ncbi:MAG: phosphoribosylglycinamide formyltransferase [Campylobacterota bacterium]|nr:phosphoribosylglycinamide formyltransferase [Campylobacterota bacterium]
MSKNIAVFASGNGNGYEAILDAIKASKLDAKIVAVVSNNIDANILNKARDEKIPTYVVNKTNTKDDQFDDKLLKILNENNTDYIFLSGYMKKISKTLINNYPQKIINCHPSLLPKHGGKGMYGRFVHQAVIDNKESKTGVTIHYVDEIYDNGKIILQKSIEVNEDDNVESLEKRVKLFEKELIVEALQQIF